MQRNREKDMLKGNESSVICWSAMSSSVCLAYGVWIATSNLGLNDDSDVPESLSPQFCKPGSGFLLCGIGNLPARKYIFDIYTGKFF